MEGHAYFWYLYATNASDYSQWPIIDNVAYVPVQVAITLLVGQLEPPDCTYYFLHDCYHSQLRGCLLCVRTTQLRMLFSFSYVVQLPVIAKALGKKPFKRYLEMFLDALFYGLVSLMLGFQIWGSLVYQSSVKMFAVVLSSSVDKEGKRVWKQNTIHTSLSVSSVFC